MGKSLGDNRRQTFGSSGFLSKRVICRVNGVDDESGLELIFARCPLCTFVRSENRCWNFFESVGNLLNRAVAVDEHGHLVDS